MPTRLIPLLFLFSLFGFSQNQFTLSGSIYESKGQETLIGANVIFPQLNTGTISNEYGFYSITLPKGTYKLTVSYLGYSTLTEIIILNQNLTRNFILGAAIDTLDEIVLETDLELVKIKTPQMSVNACLLYTSPSPRDLH